MKKLFILLIFIMLNQLIAQKPKPISGYNFKFPEYEIKSTNNNIQLLLIKDDKQPITNIRLIIGGGTSVESKTGVADLTAAMLTKGAGELSALQIAESLDGIGASLSINAADDFIVANLEVLNKHLDKALEIFELIINNPTFDKRELEKIKKLAISSIIADKANPSSLASNLSKIVIYGENHPYSKFARESDIEKIEVDDLKNYYKKYLHARNMSLAIYGDYSDESIQKIKNIISKITDDKETKPIIDVPNPKPLPKGIYFIEREGSVQSTVRVLFPAPSFNDYDYETLSFNGSIIGASFTGRLFRTLREKYSFTYSPSGGLTNKRFSNYFYAAADVKEAVTDSSIEVINEQIFNLYKSEISNDELESIKKYKSGSYMMNFENSSFVAAMLQNSEFKGKKARQVESFLDRLKNIQSSQVSLSAKKFLKEDQVKIVVVGPASIKSKLEKFGKVYEYDKNIMADAGYSNSSLDSDDLLEKYNSAIGGMSNLKKIESLLTTGKGTANLQGREMPTELYEYRKSGNKLYQKLDVAGMAQQKWINENDVWINAGGMEQKMDINDAFKLESKIFGVSQLEKSDYALKVLGEKENKVALEAVSPSGTKTIYMFDSSTYLLISSSTSEQTPQGLIEIETKYLEYTKTGELTLPSKVKSTTPMFSYELNLEYKFNTNEKIEFTPSK
ncbi:pitrilysin family protein [Candidatus Kapabacteria bacterium]|nr:pitrilysin family protein [Candidatus Kapabacteria bacterium]